MQANSRLLLIGAGYMATEYAKVLEALGQRFVVVGRGEKAATSFKKKFNLPVTTGGIDRWLKNNKEIYSHAIVAVGGEELGKTTLGLLNAGFKKILVEKPGGLDVKEIEKVARVAQKEKARVFIAYNRRFYASVEKTKEIISKEGGVKSFTFDFTERSYLIASSNKSKVVKKNWLLHNSTHVIDLAFYLCGKAKKISSYKTGSLSWYPSGSVFVGAGETDGGALFSYHANWESAGRWGVEVFTSRRHLILRPLEKLSMQEIGSDEIKTVVINDNLDIRYKSGIYKEVQAFLKNDFFRLCSIDEQCKNLKIYKKICHE